VGSRAKSRASAAPARPHLWKVVNSRLGRALVLHESARRSTDSRGPEAEIDHLGSFQALIWMQTRASAAPARPNLWKYKHFRAATRIYGLPEGGA
jgi:hypothetical protein